MEKIKQFFAGRPVAEVYPTTSPDLGPRRRGNGEVLDGDGGSRRVRFSSEVSCSDVAAMETLPAWQVTDHDEPEKGPHSHMPDLRKTPPSSRGSLFTNFEDVQLTDEERLYLNASAMGDVPMVRSSLEETEMVLNCNCLDYMGRSALHLAVDSESMDCIEILLDKLNFECIEEALLHAISKGSTKIVKTIIEHPNYMAGEDQIKRTGMRDPFFRTEEKSQFSPDITPLILSAHYNNHEIIQMFLARDHTIEKPHPISCTCTDCVTKQNYDSLKRSRSRLNAYRALASPAYMALASPDPIMSTFELRQEMKKLAQVEKEFKNEYLSLVEQCMDFACEMMDLCRGTQEVEAVLSEGADENGKGDPLARLKMAIEYEEKKFVAHPNCQQHLTSIWHGPEMGFMQSLNLWKNFLMWAISVPLVPVFCLVYIFSPDSKIGKAVRCPATKFITHTISHITFLILLAAATFRLEDQPFDITSLKDLMNSTYVDNVTHAIKVETLLKVDMRPANTLITNVQICLMFWVAGLLWMECKQMYSSGLRVYLLDNYNGMDFMLLSLYLASYVLRFLVDHWIKETDRYFAATSRARDVLLAFNYTHYTDLLEEINQAYPSSYFITASRFQWRPDDPEIVSDVLFAVANVISIARTTYLMPAFEVLGPLQISLGRMLGDITRFLVLFTLVLFAFMVGLHNLYWYYGSQKFTMPGTNDILHATEAFQGLPRTFYSLFWSMFGLIPVDSVQIKYPEKVLNPHYTFPGGNHATTIIEGVGMFLFGLYHIIVIIVLVNMLIAMMSHSFEDIQTDCDVEWKFARTKLWMNYIDEGSTLPVPFNMIPTPKSCKYAMYWMKDFCSPNKDQDSQYERNRRQTFIKSRREDVCQTLNLEVPETNYADILQRLVRRYLFKMERQRMEGEGKEINPITSLGTEVYTSGDYRPPEADTVFADSEVHDDLPPPPAYGSDNHLAPPSQDGQGRRRRMSVRPTGGTGSGPVRPARSRRPSISAPAPNVQLLSIPQLDQIQRSLKLLDVRLQHVQSNVKEDEKLKDDVHHIRSVMSENQKALGTIVTVLGAIQEELRNVSICVHNSQQQTIKITAPKKRSSHDKREPEKSPVSLTTSVEMDTTLL